MLSLLRESREDELWQLCCGFLDLNIQQFMDIQNRLLREQLQLLARSRLGRRLFGASVPVTVEEFRSSVPFTTYADYCPELLERREDTLPVKPLLWQHTSGRTGEYAYKWVPITAEASRRVARTLLAVAILSACRERSHITRLSESPRMVYAVAPRPYTSGTMVYLLNEAFPLRCMPPLAQAEAMAFEDRIRDGFRMALREGLDGFGGLTLALVAVGEQMLARTKTVSLTALLSQPAALARLAGGRLKSIIAGRPFLPQDVWPIKGIVGGGTDSAVLRERVKTLWGRYPLDTYSCTEGFLIATQTWDFQGMTFIPDLNYIEFIPEDESARSLADRTYSPRSVTLDGVKAGSVYEMVLTNFHGGPLTRYRLGDMVRILSLGNDNLKITVPQMTFERRADDLIDLAGFVRLTEKTIWQSIENDGIPYEDWTARKAIGTTTRLELFLELKKGAATSIPELEDRLYTEMMRLDERVNAASIYHTLVAMVGGTPLKVTLLPAGAFAAYTRRQRERGADLAHLKPPHINPSSETLTSLLNGTAVVRT